MKVTVNGERLKELRKLNGLSLTQLTQMSGISYPALSRYESSSHVVLNSDKLYDVCHALGITPEELNDTSIPLEQFVKAKKEQPIKKTTKKTTIKAPETKITYNDLISQLQTLYTNYDISDEDNAQIIEALKELYAIRKDS